MRGFWMNQEYPKTQIVWNKEKNPPKLQNSKMPRNMPKLAIRPLTRVLYPSGSVVSTFFLRQNQPKKTFFFVSRFETTSKQNCSNLRPLLSITFPQGFRITKNIGHWTLGNGDKKTFKRYVKSEHTDGQTDTRTFWLIESIGSEGRCFEKLVFVIYCFR